VNLAGHVFSVTRPLLVGLPQIADAPCVQEPAARLKPRAIKSKSCGLTLVRYVSLLQWAS